MKKVFSFHSVSSPHDFIARAKDEAVDSYLRIEQIENNFDLQINVNHGGRIVYRANISADENGGSFIRGEIITIPWNSKSEKKENLFQKSFQKILSVLIYIMILPVVLIFLLCYGIYSFFVRLFHGRNIEKNIESTNEEKLCDFMINKMCCTQKEE